MFDKDQAIEVLTQTPELVGDDPTDPAFMTAVIILTRLGRRKDVFNTARMTEYPQAFVASVRRNLVNASIWPKDPNAKETFLPEFSNAPDFNLAFIMAVLCGTGQVVRSA